MRKYKKETKWEQQTYKRFVFKARKDNGEYDRLVAEIGNGTFADWVRKKLNGGDTKNE